MQTSEQQWPIGQGFLFQAAKIEGQTGMCVAADAREKTYKLIDGTTRTFKLFEKMTEIDRLTAEREFRLAGRWPIESETQHWHENQR